MQRKAKQVGVMAMVVSGFVGVVVAASIYLLRNDVGLIFTSNATVVDEAAGICGLTSAGFSVLSIFYVMYGILQGQARSGMISIVFVVGVSDGSHPPSPKPTALLFNGGAARLEACMVHNWTNGQGASKKNTLLISCYAIYCGTIQRRSFQCHTC